MVWIIFISIFLIPISSIVTIPGTIVWYPQLLALQFIGGICFASRFWKLNKILALFLAYLCFSYVYVTGANLRTLMCLMIGFMAISVTLSVSKIKETKYLYYALCAVSVMSILYAILQLFGIDPIFTPLYGHKKDIVSFMGSHNQLGIFSAANAFWFPYFAPLAVIPIFLAKCNSAFIGLVAGGLFCSYFIYGKKYMIIGIFAVCILIIPWWHFCHKGSPEINERLNLWKLTLQQTIQGKVNFSNPDGKRSIITVNPAFGFGLGNFFSFSPFSQYKMYGYSQTVIYEPEKDGDYHGKIQHFYEHAHNDLIEALFEFGYFGFALLISLIISLGIVFAKSIKTIGVITTFSSLLSQSICSFSVYVFHAPVSLFIFCLTLGLFYAEVNNAKQS